MDSSCDQKDSNSDMKDSNSDKKDSDCNKRDCQKEGVAMRNCIINMRLAGRPISWIAKEMKISRSTVYKWLHRWENGRDLKDLPRSGAPRKTSQEIDQIIAKEATDNNSSNAMEIKGRLNLGVSVHTVRKRLIEQGVRKWSPAQLQKWANEHSFQNLHHVSTPYICSVI